MSVVFAKIRGGLGNQMFQYAMARAVAWRNRAQLKLDLYDLSQEFNLGNFKIQASITSQVELAKWGLRDPNWSRLLPSFAKSRWQSRIPRYFEPHYHFAAETQRLQTPIYVNGFWHSYKYFDDCSELIQTELTLSESTPNDVSIIANEIQNTTSVSLHVRRGDYISSDEYRTTYLECRPEYYARAIAHITERVGRMQVFVFSDDIDWVRRNLTVSDSMTFVSKGGRGSPIYDMYLMSLCKHHVIANSSFSWWGAWLNPSPNKIVITPERWYYSSDWSTRDLIPPGWIRM